MTVESRRTTRRLQACQKQIQRWFQLLTSRLRLLEPLPLASAASKSPASQNETIRFVNRFADAPTSRRHQLVESNYARERAQCDLAQKLHMHWIGIALYLHQPSQRKNLPYPYKQCNLWQFLT